MGFLLTGTGCLLPEAFKVGDPPLDPPAATPASSLNIYNCSEDYPIKPFTQKDGFDWVPGGSLDPMPAGGQCPESAGVTHMDLGTGPHTLKLIYWNFDPICNPNDPTDADCLFQLQFFFGDDAASVHDVHFIAP